MNKAIEVQAPNEVVLDSEYVNVFLAGSIEMGFKIKKYEDIRTRRK